MAAITDNERRWMAAWRSAAVELDRIWREELRRVDTQQALLALADAFESCRLHYPPSPTSGLVEQQRYFRRWKG